MDEVAGCDHVDDWPEPHPCPYKADVNEDSESLCRCCEDCMQVCADDI